MARMRPCHGRPSISQAVSSSWKFLSHCTFTHSSLRPSCYTLCRPKCCFPHCRPISYQCRCPLFRPSPSRLLQSVMNCAKVLEMLKFSNGKAAALILEFEHINVQRVVYAQSKYSNMFMNFTFPIIAVSQDQFEFPREVIRSRPFLLNSPPSFLLRKEIIFFQSRLRLLPLTRQQMLWPHRSLIEARLDEIVKA